MGTQLTIGLEPLDEWRCRVTGLDLGEAPGHDADSDGLGESLPARVLDALSQIPGVQRAQLEGGTPVFTRDAAVSWSSLEEAVRYAVETAVTNPTPVPHSAALGGDLGDDAMFDTVGELLDAQVNPSVARHGGKVELVDVQNGTVVLRMLGGCHGCGMASVTLKQGIESTLRRSVPGLRGIVDITDHASGTNPYFT